MLLVTNESMEELLAKARKLNADSISQVDPTYLAQIELIYTNRTTYPYKDGKQELAEYIWLWKNDIPDTATMKRFIQLWHKLKKHGVIPDDVAIHSAKLTEEYAKKRELIENKDTLIKQEALVEQVGAKWKVLKLLDWARGK